MQIMINDCPERIELSTLADLVQSKNLNLNGVAILVNGEIAVKEKYGSIVLREGDRLEIIRFVGGG